MRIYTRSGDDGQTSLIWGRRIGKDSLRVEAYGTIDEANSTAGVAVSQLPDAGFADVRSAMTRVQRDLFDLGRDLATPDDKRDGFYITAEDVKVLEQLIDRFDAENDRLTQFVLPGGHPSAALFHQARTTVRRAERLVVALQRVEDIQPEIAKYLNRLSDLMFVVARLVNKRLGIHEPTVDFQGEKPNPFQEDNA
jgi:cob(I)alamin adenosyltransferase